MLVVKCADLIKDGVHKSLLTHLEPLRISERSLTETKEGFTVSGTDSLYCGTPDFKNGKLFFLEDYTYPAELLENVKTEYPDITVRGSIQFGDDNSRQFFWFESTDDSPEIKVDYAFGCSDFSDSEGCPGYSLPFVYEIPTDYGTVPCSINNEEEFLRAAEIVSEFNQFILGKEDAKIKTLWSRYVEIYNLTDQEACLFCLWDPSQAVKHFFEFLSQEFNNKHPESDILKKADYSSFPDEDYEDFFDEEIDDDEWNEDYE